MSCPRRVVYKNKNFKLTMLIQFFGRGRSIHLKFIFNQNESLRTIQDTGVYFYRLDIFHTKIRLAQIKSMFSEDCLSTERIYN